MRRLPSPRAVPWLVLLQAAGAAREHWQRLDPAERAELQRLLRTSRGRRAALSRREQDDLRRIVRKLDLPGLGRDLIPIATRRRRRR